MYQLVSTLLNSPSKRLSKSPLAMLLVGIEDNVHETMECRDESALRCGCLHAKLSATVTGENYVPRINRGSAFYKARSPIVDCTAICISFLHHPT